MNKKLVKGVHVYVITNKLNGKKYVGFTKSPRKRFSEHAKPSNDTAIGRAIRKYGKNNFTFRIVESYETVQEASNREIELIAELGTFGSSGYNMTEGGEGCSGHFHTDEWKREHTQRLLKRVEEGTHPFAGENGSRLQRDLVDSGEHPFLEGEMQRRTQLRLLSEGKHNFQKFSKEERRKASQKGAKRSWTEASPEAKKLRCERIGMKVHIAGVKRRYKKGCSRPEDLPEVERLKERGEL